MAANQRPVVTEIIETFKSRPRKSVREQIGSAQFDDLAIMIDEPIRAEIACAADMVEKVTRKLGESSRGTELGL